MRAFYYPDANSFTCFHTHDEDLSVKNRDRVIYLYRDPVETIYSQMNYYKENLSDTNRVNYWASLYGRHLNKWLHEEDFTKNKVVLTYENLKSDLTGEFAKLANFLDVPYYEKKVLTSAEHVTKERVKEKTQHDAQVINLKEKYKEDRNTFMQNHDELIYRVLKDINPSLLSLFHQ
ncbi:MAG: sulfotransferase domain-containing protein [Bacteroidota bacterium]